MRHQAIYNTHPNVVSVDDGLGAFDENGNSVTIDETKVAEEVASLEADFKSKQYQRDRAASYPDLAEQLDLLYHDMTAGKGDKTGEWYKAVNKVKTDNPKPE